MEPKQKQCPVVDVTGDGSKVQCYKEQYCIGTWNVRFMNVQEAVIKTIPPKNKFKKTKWLSEEALQIAEERRE